jgi:DNA-binding transcriptional regulator YiaG
MKASEVAEIRKALGLTQLELGQKLELSGPRPDRTVRNWESDGVTGPVAVALRLLLKEHERS